MARVKGRDTKPELVVRRTLHALGYRFRLHRKDLPGRPDLVFAGRCKVILVHGCFWHAHHCRYGLAVPKSNIDFWQDKFAKNTTRDRLVNRKLKGLGWQVHIVWECDVKQGSWLEKALAFLEN